MLHFNLFPGCTINNVVHYSRAFSTLAFSKWFVYHFLAAKQKQISLYHKTDKKALTVLCSVGKHSGSDESTQILISCSRDFMGTCITEQSTVMPFSI